MNSKDTSEGSWANERLLQASGKDEEDENRQYAQAAPPSPYEKRFFVVSFCLCLSVLFNIYLATWGHFGKTNAVVSSTSTYAHLSRDTPMQFDPYSQYGTGNKNETDRSILWESLDSSPGNIALDKAEAQQLGLPESQNFPWDSSKSLYLLNGHHSLHCLRKVRRWVTIAHHNGTQLDTYAHVVHCMDFLLQNILCEADDTPMYSTASARKDAGNGQTRMCRSWDKLNEWATAHTSCYHFLNETQGVNSTFERYVWCPHDTPYAEVYRDYLKKPADWYKPRPKEIDSMPRYWEEFTDDVFQFHELTDHT